MLGVFESFSLMPEVMETNRIVLRPSRCDDVEDVFAYASDEEWARYMASVPEHYSHSDAVDFVSLQMLLDRVVHPSWAIVSEGRVIGGINIRFSAEHRLGEMGWSIARSAWGRGLATEAAQAVLDGAFQTYSQLHRIRAMADARNAASQRVMEKIGMIKEGTLRQNRVARGVLIDEAWFGLLRPEWEARRGVRGVKRQRSS